MAQSPKSLVLVTGASRGLGREIALQLSIGSHKLQNADFCLLSRSESDLSQLKTEIQAQNAMSKVVVVPIDLAQLSQDLEKKLSPFFEMVHDEKVVYDKLYLFNNAGSIDPISKICDMSSKMAEVNQNLSLNITSVVLLTSAVLGAAKKKGIQSGVVVNISSLAAVVPFECWGLYNTGKAARKMFHEVLAKEEKSWLKVLNYQPGIVATKMQEDIRDSDCPSDVGKFLANVVFEKKKAMTAETSVHELVLLLEKDEYESGESIDIYKIRPELNPSGTEEKKEE